jgi:uncharacterized protein
LFEWDEKKRQSNLEKHGVDFTSMRACDWSSALLIEDERKNYGERRFVVYTPLHDRLHVVVYADRGSVRRLISARKANSREVRFYETETDPPH